MNETIQKLKEWGCDTEGTLGRIGEDEEFYLECLNDLKEGNEFNALYSALESRDSEASFTASHSLKGVLANLGITPIYEVVCALVESLRHGNDIDYAESENAIRELENRFASLLP